MPQRESWLETLAVPAVGLGVALSIVFAIAYSSRRSDFIQDYIAAYSLRHGLPLYDRPTTESLARQLTGVDQYNLHPPTNAVLFVPLTYVPYKVAFVAWNVVGLCVLAILLKTIIAETGLSAPAGHGVAAAVLLSQPFVANTALGQVSLYVALAVLWAWVLLRRRRDTLAGAIVGAIGAVKLFPLFLLVFLAATRRWRAVATCCGVVLAAFAGAWLIVGTPTWRQYWVSVVPENTRDWSGFPLNFSLHGATAMLTRDGSRWTSGMLSAAVGRNIALALAATLAAATAAVSAKARGCVPAEEQAFMGVIAAMLLVSPVTWSHMFLALVWPGATVLRDWAVLTPRVRAFTAAAFATLTLPHTTLTQWLVAGYAPQPIPWAAALPLMLPTLGVLVLWGIFAMRSLRVGRTSCAHE